MPFQSDKTKLLFNFSQAFSPAGGHCREELAVDVVWADVANNVLFIFGAAWCSWCLVAWGVSHQAHCWVSVMSGVCWCEGKATLWAAGHAGESVLQAGRGSGRCMKGSNHQLPLRLHWRGDLLHHSQLLQLQHPQQDWSHLTARSISLQRRQNPLIISLNRWLFSVRFPHLKLSHLLRSCRGKISWPSGQLQGNAASRASPGAVGRAKVAAICSMPS